MSLNLDAYKDRHVGQRAYLVGKGPSLDSIQESLAPFNMEGGVVFCLNEAIHKIEALNMDLEFQTPLYCVQQDSELETAAVPTHENTIHFQNSWMHSPTRKWKARESTSPWNPKAVLYQYPEWLISGVVAIEIMHLMGIREMSLVCFDGLLKDGPMTYAQCIPYRPSIHKANGIGNHGANGGMTIEKARELGMNISTMHPEIPGLKF